MAKASDDAEFDKEKRKNEADTAFIFPSEFPYKFDSFGTEPVEFGSTGMKSSDEEDFFAGLTCRLSHASLHEARKQLIVPICERTDTQRKARVLAGSPQSTLNGIRSWLVWSTDSGDGSSNWSSRVPSPTPPPYNATNDAWDVLYAATSQVARLKMNGDVSSKFDFQNRGLLGGLPPPIMAENAFFC